MFLRGEGGWYPNAHYAYLMMLYVIFPIHLNFPITFRCVLKDAIHRKKTVNCFMLFEIIFFFFFFSKRCFYYNIVHICYIWLTFPFYYNLFLFFMFLYLSFINYFHHITFYKHGPFSVFLRDFPFNSFLLTFRISGGTFCVFNYLLFLLLVMIYLFYVIKIKQVFFPKLICCVYLVTLFCMKCPIKRRALFLKKDMLEKRCAVVKSYWWYM